MKCIKLCNFGKLKKKIDIHPIGSSSLRMHDVKKLIKSFNIKKGDTILDLGCGPGDYSLEISKSVGETGKIIAIDENEDVINYFKKRIRQNNIKTYTHDILKKLPLDDSSADICIIITVLHALNIKKHSHNFFKEMARVLKPHSKLFIINVKKENYGFGPPMSMRIPPEELKKIVPTDNFIKTNFMDLGYNYLMEFKTKK